jgi:tetratricopeptide (TPR) repeat protein
MKETNKPLFFGTFYRFAACFLIQVTLPLSILCLYSFSANADTNRLPTANPIFAAFARSNYLAAEKIHKSEPENNDATWQFARACFDLGEFATNNTERAEIAQIGISAARSLLARVTNSAPGHYYLGMNLGQMARTKLLGAFKLVDQMEHEFSIARKLAETFDNAGPDRNLGLLYLDAPTVGSIGSKSKAREHLERAVTLAPDFPENRLNMIEAYLKWGEYSNAKKELKALDKVWPAAKAKLTGPAFDASWADWEMRLDPARKKIEEKTKSK